MFVFYYLKDGGSRCGIHFRGSEIRLEPFFEYAFRSIRLQVFSFGGYCSGETVDPEQPIDIHMLDTSEFFVSYVFFCLLPSYRLVLKFFLKVLATLGVSVLVPGQISRPIFFMKQWRETAFWVQT